MATHYDTLHVMRTASPEAIKAAYRQQCQKWHPDKNPENSLEAERISKIINGAYEVLSDPDRRRAYDASLLRSEPIRRPAFSEAQQRAAEEARHAASEQMHRWMAEEMQRRAHTQPFARNNHRNNSLLSQVKFAFTFLCILCFFSCVIVVLLTA